MKDHSQNVKIYLRFHKDVDAAIRVSAEENNCRPATFVSSYLEKVTNTASYGCPAFSSLCDIYRPKPGRSADHAPRVIGKPMIITVSLGCYRKLQLWALQNEARITQICADLLTTEMLLRHRLS